MLGDIYRSVPSAGSAASSVVTAIPKFREQRPLVIVEQNVARFDVPVDEALLVGVVQGVGNLGHEPSSVSRRHQLPMNQIGEAPTLDILRHEEA